MKLTDLRNFPGPAEYPAAFAANLALLSKSDTPCSGLCAALAADSGLSEGEVSIELKKFICTANEHFPVSLRPDRRGAFAVPYFLYKALRYSLGARPPLLNARAGVLVDAWYPQAAGDFYGETMMSALKAGASCAEADFSSFEYFTLGAALSVLRGYCRALLLARKISSEGGPSLWRFVYRFYSWLLTGRELARTGVKLVVSGNDNGCPPVKVKAAGARSVLIQNGLRTYLSDTCFKQGDYYVSMGKGKCLDVFRETGCEFREFFPLGSIRLANYLESRGGARAEEKFDLLLVESGYLMVFFNPGYFSSDVSHFSGSFSPEAELKALGLVTEFAERSGLRVAVQTQFKGELDLMKKLGCHSGKITYFERGERPVYQTMLESRLILSTVSTVCMEALGLGKKAGYINFSGNSNINRPFRDLDAEYTAASKETFDDFVRRVNGTPPAAAAALIRQVPRYPAALAALIRSKL